MVTSIRGLGRGSIHLGCRADSCKAQPCFEHVVSHISHSAWLCILSNGPYQYSLHTCIEDGGILAWMPWCSSPGEHTDRGPLRENPCRMWSEHRWGGRLGLYIFRRTAHFRGCCFDSTLGFPGEGPEGGRTRGRAYNQLGRGRIHLATCNVTAWGSIKGEFDNSAGFVHGYHVISVAEHKLADEHKRAAAQQFLGLHGWKGLFTEAGAGKKGGPSAGVGFLWPNFLKMFNVGVRFNHSRAVSAELEVTGIGPVILVAVYGWVDDVMKTLSLLDEIRAYVTGSGQPWFVMGDFNVGASDMHSWLTEAGGWGSVWQNGPTCFAGPDPTTIDYFIARPGMECIRTSMTVVECSLATHKPFGISLKGGGHGRVRVLAKPVRAPTTPVFGPRLALDSIEVRVLSAQARSAASKWSSRKVSAAGPDIEQVKELDRLHQAWNEAARGQAAQAFGVELPTAGDRLRYEWKDPADLVRAKMPKSTQALYAATWLYRRVTEVAKVGSPVGTRWWVRWVRLLEGWRKEEVLGSASVNLFLSIWTSPVYAADHIKEKARALLPYFEAPKEKTVAKDRKAQSDRWSKVKKEVESGASVGFRLVKGKKAEMWADEVGDISNVALLQRQADKWASVWEANNHTGAWDIRTCGADLSNLDLPEPITAKQIRESSRSFKVKTTAVEGWHPRSFAQFSDELLGALADIWSLAECWLKWPKAEEEMLAKLIAKPSGGLRPIMWFRSSFRTYARIRRSEIREWFVAFCKKWPEVNMAPGRHTTDAVWREQMRRCLHHGQTKSAEINWDLSKAFDHVGRAKLFQIAVQRGYPAGVLANSLVSYGWQRKFILDTEVSGSLASHRGIAPGSPSAPYELAVYLAGLSEIVAAYRASIEGMRIVLSVHVDDIALTVAGPSTEEVVHHSSQLAEALANHIEGELSMCLDLKDKAFTMASDTSTLRGVMGALGRLAGQAADSIKRLGVDHAIQAGAWKLAGNRKKRYGSGKARFTRLRACRLVRQGSRVVYAGIVPHITYGAELYQPSKGELRQLASMCGLVGRVRPIGVQQDLVWAIEPSRDPALIFVRAAVIRWVREVWMLWSDKRPGDIMSVKELMLVARVIMEAPLKDIPEGPAKALRAALDTLGWKLKGALILVDHRGWEIDLEEVSPAAFGKKIADRWRDILFHKWAQKTEVRRARAGCADLALDRQLTTELIKTRGFTPLERARSLQIVSGTCPTASWLHAHGWQVGPMCARCGGVDDTLGHRLSACWGGFSGRLLSQQGVWKALCTPEVPDKLHPDGCVVRIVGSRILEEGEEFRFQPGDIYTDGSVLWGRWDKLASGGFAMAQVDAQGNMERLVAVSSKAHWGHYAAATEHDAIFEALGVLPAEGGVVFVTDCQAVVQGGKRFLESADNPGLPFTGVWRHMRHVLRCQEPRVSFRKTKAHRERKDVPAEELVDFLGNQLVDEWARRAATDRSEILAQAAVTEYEAKLKELRSVVKWVSAQEWPDAKALGKAPGAQVRQALGDRLDLHVASKGHHWIWTQKRWWCGVCGTYAAHRNSGTGCPGKGRPTSLGEGHALHAGRMDSGLPLMFCSKCGGIRVGSSAGLRKSCSSMKGNRSRLAKLQRGLHPDSGHPFSYLSPIRHGFSSPVCEPRGAAEPVEQVDWAGVGQQRGLAQPSFLETADLIGHWPEGGIEVDPGRWEDAPSDGDEPYYFGLFCPS